MYTFIEMFKNKSSISSEVYYQIVDATLYNELKMHYISEDTCAKYHAVIFDKKLYLIMIRKPPYYDPRDFNAPEIIQITWQDLMENHISISDELQTALKEIKQE